MGQDPPHELSILLDGSDPLARDRAWSSLLSRYQHLLLRAARSFGGDHDDRMDRYQHVVESLAADEFRRLRAYRQKGLSSFTAWLTVVARRLCVDFDRTRFGRAGRGPVETEETREVRRIRRRLVTFQSSLLDLDQVPSDQMEPDAELRRTERDRILSSVLAELEPSDRLLLRLRFDDDLPIRRIVEVMPFPTVFHAYRRLRAVLQDVRRRLEARGFEGSQG